MRDLVILFGGSSGERRVSVASAQNVASLLEQAEAWFWAPDGAIHQVERAVLLAHQRAFEEEFAPAGAPAYPSLALFKALLLQQWYGLSDPGLRRCCIRS